MRTGISLNPLLLLVAASLAAIGMWLYAQRVLVPFQIADAAIHQRPRGNFSDLYPRWIGARELLLRGRDPYGTDISREIQVGYYGRALDPNRPGDPSDQQGFAYPVYVVFFLAPTMQLNFGAVQVAFFWLLVVLTCFGTLLWIRILHWDLGLWNQVALVLLALGTPPAMQGIKLQQLSLFVAGLVAIAFALLVTDHGFPAGVLLAVSTIKPQLVILLVLWLAIWTLVDWRHRYRWAVSFLATMAILLAVSEWYAPHWIPRFVHALGDYQRYTHAMSLLESLIGAPWSWALNGLAFAGLLAVCWSGRRVAAKTPEFAFIASLVLALTVLLLPTSSTYNQVFLLPALLWLVKERRAIWRRSVLERMLLVVTVGLMVWPWIAAITLVGLSFRVAPATIESVWRIPLWTVTQLPVGVAALILVRGYQKCYQQTFTEQPNAGAS